MQNQHVVQAIEMFENASDEAANVYRQGNELKQIILEAPEGEINNTTMNILHQAIEGLVERSGVFYSTLSMESACTRTELKTVSVEGLGNFIREVWEKIKKAFFALVDKIKEFFIGNERKAEKIKENIDKAVDDLKEVQEEALKKDEEGTELVVDIENPSPAILHKSYMKKPSSVVSVKFHDLVQNFANYCMKSREHHLLEWVSDFKEDMLSLLDIVNPKMANPEIINEVYAILNNYVSEKKLTALEVSNIRKFKGLSVTEEFDSDYGNKRYVVKFGVGKEEGNNSSESLYTEQIISKAFKINDVDRLSVSGVEVLDMKHLENALLDNHKELANYIKISKEINALNLAVLDMIKDIDKGADGEVDPSHVVTLGLISKTINAVSKLFSTLQSDVMLVLVEHTKLYSLFTQKFKEKLLNQQ